jgi:hypothetical protein
MTEVIIHTVKITEEAEFDYAVLFGDRNYLPWEQALAKFGGDRQKAFDFYDRYDTTERFDKKKLKADLEEYIGYLAADGHIPWWGYFRADYEDEATGVMLKLFIYKGERFGIMQNWNVVGLMRSEDRSWEAEDNGEYREMYKISVKEPDKNDGYRDRAVSDRVRDILQNTEKTLWDNVLKEVLDAFKYERDKKDAEKMAFLQSYCFSFRNRRRAKKADRRN